MEAVVVRGRVALVPQKEPSKYKIIARGVATTEQAVLALEREGWFPIGGWHEERGVKTSALIHVGEGM